MGKDYHNYSRVSKTPRRPYEAERLDRELKLIGQYGLKNKREVWRVQYTLAKIRSVARNLLTLDPKNPKRVFEGTALLRRLSKLGVISDKETRLDNILNLNVEKFLDRRLQTLWSNDRECSIHEARVTIRNRHIRVGRRMVNVPSFMVTRASETQMGFTEFSALRRDGTLGRHRKKKAKKAQAAKSEE